MSNRQPVGGTVAIAHRVVPLWRGAAMRCDAAYRGIRCTDEPRYVCETDFGGRRGVVTTERAVRCERHALRYARRFDVELPTEAVDPVVPMTFDEWVETGERLYGEDRSRWVFVCPSCGNRQSIEDFQRLTLKDVDPRSVAPFSCIGRWSGAQGVDMCSGRRPCNYTGGGLFNLNPQKVTDDQGAEHWLFAFADSEGG